MNTKAPTQRAGAIETHLNTTRPEDEPRQRRRARKPFADTSRLSYERASKGRWVIYSAILALLAEHGPMTDDQLHRLYLLGPWPVRSRQNIGTARRELADAKLVRDTGRRGLSDMGNSAILWERSPDDGEE